MTRPARMTRTIRIGWFICIGGASTIAYMSIAWLLTVPLGWWPALGSALAYCLCSIGTFVSHRTFTFRSSAPVQSEISRYVGTTAIGYGIAIALPLLLTQSLHFDPRLAIILVVVATSALNYVLLNSFVFRSSGRPQQKAAHPHQAQHR